MFDWNQIEQAKSLGAGRIALADLEPFQASERAIALSSPKHGEKGAVRVRLLFQPEIIAKTRKNTSTFSSAGRAMTQIGHIPVGAGRGVIHGVTGVFRRGSGHGEGHAHEDAGAGMFDEEDRASVASVPAGQASQPVGALSASATAGAEGAVFPSLPSANGAGPTPGLGQEGHGTLRVVVMDAKDLSAGDAKPYVVVRVGDREHKTRHASKTAAPEWSVRLPVPPSPCARYIPDTDVPTRGVHRNESFAFSAAPATQPKMFAWVYDHKTLGKDRLLGSAEIDVRAVFSHCFASASRCAACADPRPCPLSPHLALAPPARGRRRRVRGGLCGAARGPGPPAAAAGVRPREQQPRAVALVVPVGRAHPRVALPVQPQPPEGGP